MKKFLSTLCLLLSLAALIGCTRISVELDEPSRPDRSTAHTTASGTTGDPTVTEPPALEPVIGKVPLPAVGEGDEIEYIPAEGQPELKKIASLESEGVVSKVSTYSRFMLVSFYLGGDGGYFASDAEQTEVMAVDLLTGEVTATARYDSVVDVGFLEDGRIYLYQYAPTVLEVYETGGELVFCYTSDLSTALCIDPADDGVAWVLDQEGTCVERLPLNGGEAQRYTLPSSGGYFQTAVDGDAYMTLFDEDGGRELVRLTKEGELQTLDRLDGYYGVGDALCKEVGGDWRYIDPRQSVDRVCYFGGRQDAYLLDADSGRFCLGWERYDDQTDRSESGLLLCQPSSGRSSELVLGDGRYLYGQSFGEDALYLLIGEEPVNGEGLFIYLWDYQNAPYTLLETGIHTIADDELENLAYAEELKDEWGISIYFGEEDMARTPSDYAAYPLGDQALISDKLLELSETLGDYPEGFFRELPYGIYDRLEIYLCGGLTPADSHGISTAIAISNTSGSALVIVLDVTAIDDLSQTFAHELMHLMERRIEQIDPSLLESWSSLTPGGDQAYYFSYHDLGGNEISDPSHTWFGEDDPDQIYFVDAYSKSYPAEDRSRIFEYLVRDRGAPFFLDSPLLVQKAERLCEIIRLTFPSVASAENVVWEMD